MTAPQRWSSQILLRLVDGGLAMTVVQSLASKDFAGRYPGSEGERRAAEFLRNSLIDCGVAALKELPDYRSPFPLVVAELTEEPRLSVETKEGRRDFEHLRDFSVSVQGAAGAGHACAESTWLGRLAEAPKHGQVAGLVGVVKAPVLTQDMPTFLENCLTQVQRARDCRLAGLVRVEARAPQKRVMIDRHEDPSIPTLTVTPAVAFGIFGNNSIRRGARGGRVTLTAPLTYRQVVSAGNIVGEVGDGPVRAVLCAHYDHLGILPDGRHFPGAADNASGVAVVLEAARVLCAAGLSLPGRVVFLLSSGEEIGLCGARHFVSSWRSILTPATWVLNIDEVAGGPGIPLRLLRLGSMEDCWLGVNARSLLDTEVVEAELTDPGFADHVPFIEAGLRRVGALFSYDPTLDVVHTVRDSVDLISPARLAQGVRAALLVVLRALEDG